VVLGDYGEVFLLDWGLAAPAGEHPEPGGTPAYMAPEVAAGGPATPAADVYGLGATLYAILTGKPPYDGPTPTQVLDKVKAADPPPPAAVAPDVPPALAAVCRKAMARDPADRYPSADDLATDTRRWLADEPVSAFRDPFTVRAVRYARRHRTAVAAAAVFLATAVVGLTASTVLVAREQQQTAAARDRAEEHAAREAKERDRAEQEKARAEGEKERAEREKERAEGNSRTAHDLAFTLGRRVYQLESGRPAGRLSDAARQQLLTEARATFGRLLETSPDDLKLMAEVASLFRYSGNLARSRNENQVAGREYLAAIGLWQKLADRTPANPHPADNLGQTRRDYAVWLKRIGKLKEARAAVDSARASAAVLKDRLPDSFYRRSLGTAELSRSEIAYLQGHFAAAEESARAADALLAGLKTVPPGEATAADRLLPGMALDHLALALRAQDRVPEAVQAHDAAVAALRPADPAATRDDRHVYFHARLNRAETLARLPDRRAGLEDELTELVVGWDRLLAENPDDVFVTEGLGSAYRVRGEGLLAAGRPEPALKDLKAAEGYLRGLYQRHPDVPEYARLLGLTYTALARRAAAVGKSPDAARLYAGNAARLFEAARKQDPENVHHKMAADALERATGGP
jgi:hypothetical protein